MIYQIAASQHIGCLAAILFLKMPVIELAPRLRIHYLDYSPIPSMALREKTAILLHGLGATSDSWILQITPLLNAGFRVLAPDTRGFGKSTFPGESSSIHAMSEDVAKFMDHLDIVSASLIGISMGGTIALQFALEYPGRLDKLMLVNTFSSLRPEHPGVWLYYAYRFLLLHTLGLPTQARAVAQRIFPRPEQNELREILVDQICQADPKGYRAAMRSLALFNVTSRLSEVHAPTLIITGECDTTVPPKNQQILVNGIKDSMQIVIPGAGHAAIADNPDEFNQAMIAFLCQPS